MFPELDADGPQAPWPHLRLPDHHDVRASDVMLKRLHGTLAAAAQAAPADFSELLLMPGEDGHPFPVPLKVYDETIQLLKRAVARAKLGSTETLAAIQRLDAQARRLESGGGGPTFDEFVAAERSQSPIYGGRTVGETLR